MEREPLYRMPTDQVSAETSQGPLVDDHGGDMTQAETDTRLPEILRPMADEIERRAIVVAGDYPDDPVILDAARELVINEVLRQIAVVDYLDEPATA